MSGADLRAAVWGFALCEADRGVHESDGPNMGPRLAVYAANADPPIHAAVAWCALVVQYVTDMVCSAARVINPLNDVKEEALVQSYYLWAISRGKLIEANQARPGDLMLFWNLSKSIENPRWDHMAIVGSRVDAANRISTLEGNTSPPSDVPESLREREGDGFYRKVRDLGRFRTCFVRWI